MKKNYYSYSNVKRKKEEQYKPDYKLDFLTRCMLAIGVFLLLLIGSKSSNEKIMEMFNYTNSHFNLAQVSNIFEKYFLMGMTQTNNDITPVYMPLPTVSNSVTYNNGVLVTTDVFEQIQVIEEGIIIKTGKINDIKNSIIVQTLDGKQYVYGNLDTISVNIYDKVNTGDVLGVAGELENINCYYLAIKYKGDYTDVYEIFNQEN